jgi:hypothetical protein
LRLARAVGELRALGEIVREENLGVALGHDGPARSIF